LSNADKGAVGLILALELASLTGGVMVLSQLIRRQMEAPSRENGQLEELSHLRKKVSSLEVMLQKMSLEREPTPELEEEGMESFLRRMAAEYV